MMLTFASLKGFGSLYAPAVARNLLPTVGDKRVSDNAPRDNVPADRRARLCIACQIRSVSKGLIRHDSVGLGVETEIKH